MARVYQPPPYNEAVMCPNCGEDADVLTGMHGIIGGGSGPYTCCELCGLVITKSFDDGQEADPTIIEGEFTNVEEDKDRSAK